jgi:hypothetical protein
MKREISRQNPKHKMTKKKKNYLAKCLISEKVEAEKQKVSEFSFLQV